MSEQQQGHDPYHQQDHNEQRESEQCYIKVARYADEHTSETPYDAIRNILYQTSYDLSVYRLRIGIDLIWHIAALGTPPPADVARRIEDLLATGEPAMLDDEMVDYLFARRAEQSKQGSWVEHQHFPRTKRRLK